MYGSGNIQPNIELFRTKGATPVVMLHCSASSGRQWDALSEVLGQRSAVAAPDQWSCGNRGPWRGLGRFSLSAEAAAVHETIDRLGRPVHLVGHSDGGALAMHIARCRPDAVASLTLIEPSAFHLLRHSHAADRAIFGEIAGVARDVDCALENGDAHSGMARFVDYWSGAGAWDHMSEKARAKFAPRLEKIALDFQALFDEPAELADFADLKLPTVIVRGSLSPAPSRRIVEMLAGALRGARVEVIFRADHMSPLSHADTVNCIVAAHIAGLRRLEKRAA